MKKLITLPLLLIAVVSFCSIHPAKASVITVTQENIVELIQNSNLPILLDFWAPWCAPCRKLNPVLQRLSKTTEGELIVAKINIDQEYKLSDGFGIESVPTLILIKNGKEIERRTGYQSFEALQEMVGQE